MAFALGLAGRIGSGKTSLSAELSVRLDCPRASFGDFVRTVAEQRGLDAGSRDVLQALGDELIAEGWEPFCRGVLALAGYESGAVVIDGIRHHEAAATLRRILSPVQLYVVGVSSPDEDRLLRLADRGLTLDEVRRADLHSNEGEVLGVLGMADVVVDRRSSPAEAADAVIAWVAGRDVHSP